MKINVLEKYTRPLFSQIDVHTKISVVIIKYMHTIQHSNVYATAMGEFVSI